MGFWCAVSVECCGNFSSTHVLITWVAVHGGLAIILLFHQRQQLTMHLILTTFLALPGSHRHAEVEMPYLCPAVVPLSTEFQDRRLIRIPATERDLS